MDLAGGGKDEQALAKLQKSNRKLEKRNQQLLDECRNALAKLAQYQEQDAQRSTDASQLPSSTHADVTHDQGQQRAADGSGPQGEGTQANHLQLAGCCRELQDALCHVEQLSTAAAATQAARAAAEQEAQQQQQQHEEHQAQQQALQQQLQAQRQQIAELERQLSEQRSQHQTEVSGLRQQVFDLQQQAEQRGPQQQQQQHETERVLRQQVLNLQQQLQQQQQQQQQGQHGASSSEPAQHEVERTLRRQLLTQQQQLEQLRKDRAEEQQSLSQQLAQLEFEKVEAEQGLRQEVKRVQLARTEGEAALRELHQMHLRQLQQERMRAEQTLRSQARAEYDELAGRLQLLQAELNTTTQRLQAQHAQHTQQAQRTQQEHTQQLTRLQQSLTERDAVCADLRRQLAVQAQQMAYQDEQLVVQETNVAARVGAQLAVALQEVNQENQRLQAALNAAIRVSRRPTFLTLPSSHPTQHPQLPLSPNLLSPNLPSQHTPNQPLQLEHFTGGSQHHTPLQHGQQNALSQQQQQHRQLSQQQHHQQPQEQLLLMPPQQQLHHRHLSQQQQPQQPTQSLHTPQSLPLPHSSADIREGPAGQPLTLPLPHHTPQEAAQPNAHHTPTNEAAQPHAHHTPTNEAAQPNAHHTPINEAAQPDARHRRQRHHQQRQLASSMQHEHPGQQERQQQGGQQQQQLPLLSVPETGDTASREAQGANSSPIPGIASNSDLMGLHQLSLPPSSHNHHNNNNNNNNNHESSLPATIDTTHDLLPPSNHHHARPHPLMLNTCSVSANLEQQQHHQQQSDQQHNQQQHNNQQHHTQHQHQHRQQHNSSPFLSHTPHSHALPTNPTHPLTQLNPDAPSPEPLPHTHSPQAMMECESAGGVDPRNSCMRSWAHSPTHLPTDQPSQQAGAHPPNRRAATDTSTPDHSNMNAPTPSCSTSRSPSPSSAARLPAQITGSVSGLPASRVAATSAPIPGSLGGAARAEKAVAPERGDQQQQQHQQQGQQQLQQKQQHKQAAPSHAPAHPPITITHSHQQQHSTLPHTQRPSPANNKSTPITQHPRPATNSSKPGPPAHTTTAKAGEAGLAQNAAVTSPSDHTGTDQGPIAKRRRTLHAAAAASASAASSDYNDRSCASGSGQGWGGPNDGTTIGAGRDSSQTSSRGRHSGSVVTPQPPPFLCAGPPLPHSSLPTAAAPEQQLLAADGKEAAAGTELATGAGLAAVRTRVGAAATATQANAAAHTAAHTAADAGTREEEATIAAKCLAQPAPAAASPSKGRGRPPKPRSGQELLAPVTGLLASKATSTPGTNNKRKEVSSPLVSERALSLAVKKVAKEAGQALRSGACSRPLLLAAVETAVLECAAPRVSVALLRHQLRSQRTARGNTDVNADHSTQHEAQRVTALGDASEAQQGEGEKKSKRARVEGSVSVGVNGSGKGKKVEGSEKDEGTRKGEEERVCWEWWEWCRDSAWIVGGPSLLMAAVSSLDSEAAVGAAGGSPKKAVSGSPKAGKAAAEKTTAADKGVSRSPKAGKASTHTAVTAAAAAGKTAAEPHAHQQNTQPHSMLQELQARLAARALQGVPHSSIDNTANGAGMRVSVGHCGGSAAHTADHMTGSAAHTAANNERQLQSHLGRDEPLGHGPEPSTPSEWPLELSERCALSAGIVAAALVADDKQAACHWLTRLLVLCHRNTTLTPTLLPMVYAALSAWPEALQMQTVLPSQVLLSSSVLPSSTASAPLCAANTTSVLPTTALNSQPSTAQNNSTAQGTSAAQAQHSLSHALRTALLQLCDAASQQSTHSSQPSPNAPPHTSLHTSTQQITPHVLPSASHSLLGEHKSVNDLADLAEGLRRLVGVVEAVRERFF